MLFWERMRGVLLFISELARKMSPATNKEKRYSEADVRQSERIKYVPLCRDAVWRCGEPRRGAQSTSSSEGATLCRDDWPSAIGGAVKAQSKQHADGL